MNTPELRWSWPRIIAALGVAVVVIAGSGVWLSAQGGPQPAFGALVLSPPNIIYNKPTNVTFTIKIDSPTLNPTTVQLQRVDLQGNVLGNLGRLYDDATHGDAVEGDKLFTAVVSLNEPKIGKSYFRAAAAFRGNRQNAQSASFSLDVDPFALPPDPGEAGKASLAGIDSDHDGVRDDVQRVAGLLALSSNNEYSALIQYSLAIQVDLLNSASVRSADEILAIRCLGYLLGLEKTATRVGALNHVIANTPSRQQALLESSRQPRAPFPNVTGNRTDGVCK